MADEAGKRATVRLVNFVELERTRLENRQGNILGTAAMQVLSLFEFLEITAHEYEQAADAFFSHSSREEAAHARAGPGPRPLTPEELKLMHEGAHMARVLHLRIETFYLFAKILLDKVGQFIQLYFGQARGASLGRHSQLRRHLSEFAQQHGLSQVPDALVSQIDELERRISDYRDDHITHSQNLRTIKSTSFKLDGSEVVIAGSPLYPADHEEGSRSESPRDLLPTIDGYLTCVLDYLERNRTRAARQTES